MQACHQASCGEPPCVDVSQKVVGINYSDGAAHKNSENVLVNWGNPKLAEVYLKHFDRNYGQAKPYERDY